MCRRRNVRKPWKLTFSITPLPFDPSSLRNPREYPHKSYIARNHSRCATPLPLIVWVYLYSNFRDGLRKRMHFKTECEMAVRGHPRSLILVPIESAYICNFLLVISSNLRPTLSPFQRYCRFLCWEERPHPYSTRILGMFPLNYIAIVVAPRCENPMLIVSA